MDELLSLESAWFKQDEENVLARESIKDHALKGRTFVVKLKCTREPSHNLYFYFLVDNSTLTKIGQYPSIADIQSDTIKSIEKIWENSSIENSTEQLV